MVFVPGNPDTQTVSPFLPESLGRVAKKVRDRNQYQQGATTLRRLRLVDDGRCWSCVNRLPRVAMGNPAQFRLFKFKRGRTDGYTADQDIDAIRARPECARAQVIDVLAIIDPEI